MGEKRQVPFRLLYDVFKSRFPFSGIGLVFVLLAMFILIPLITILDSSKAVFEKYDYNLIAAQGMALKAKVVSIETETNVTVDNQFHPQIIEYAFTYNGQFQQDKFRTLTSGSGNAHHVGDEVKIKLLNGASVMEDLKPFTFPFQMFYILPFIFLLIGIPFMLIGLLPAIRNYGLYKNGIEGGATILSIAKKGVIPVVRISYRYIGANGNKIVGSSISNDLLLLSGKKVQGTIKIFVSARDENISCIVPRALLPLRTS